MWCGTELADNVRSQCGSGTSRSSLSSSRAAQASKAGANSNAFTTISVQFVPACWLFLFDFAVRAMSGTVLAPAYAVSGTHIAYGATRDEHGQTPLHLACKNGDLPILSLLLLARADPLVVDHDGSTALHTCAANVQLEAATVSALICTDEGRICTDKAGSVLRGGHGAHEKRVTLQRRWRSRHRGGGHVSDAESTLQMRNSACYHYCGHVTDARVTLQIMKTSVCGAPNPHATMPM
eukprot:2788257-Rhodomonas_salina.1